MAILSIENNGNFERFLTSGKSQNLVVVSKLYDRPYESRTLSSIYYYELLAKCILRTGLADWIKQLC